jgi:hypothetical protein
MRHAAWAAWIPVAFWALAPTISVLPSLSVRAQQSDASAIPLSRTDADAQLASLLEKIEAFLDEGHVTSPAAGNASDTFSRALMVSSFASAEAIQKLANFPSVLKKRAEAQKTAGHTDISIRYEIFAEVVSSILAAGNAKSDAHSATVAEASSPSGTTNTAGPPRQDAATPASRRSGGEAEGNNSARATTQNPEPSATSAPPTTDLDLKPPARMGPTQTTAAAQQVLPPTPELDSHASSSLSGGARSPGPPRQVQVAALPPASEVNAAPMPESPKPPEPSAAPPMSSSMIDALLQQGNAMLSVGDISAARLLFTPAAESGSGKAAMALGDTYSPIFLAERGVVGSLADPDLAKTWYRKAVAFGEPEARQRLLELGGNAQTEAVGSAKTQ